MYAHDRTIYCNRAPWLLRIIIIITSGVYSTRAHPRSILFPYSNEAQKRIKGTYRFGVSEFRALSSKPQDTASMNTHTHTHTHIYIYINMCLIYQSLGSTYAVVRISQSCVNTLGVINDSTLFTRTNIHSCFACVSTFGFYPVDQYIPFSSGRSFTETPGLVTILVRINLQPHVPSDALITRPLAGRRCR